ncbi:hypothetical protein, partial [Butyrivibrio sp. WCE2006]|uniref:hypothetical protein n=1 Tax=Butyrivibrio sp. WCE2006 TaxID=1410611 RepID=UPI0018CC6CA0
YTLEEFSDSDINDIIANIDEPKVSKVRMEPGHTNTEIFNQELIKTEKIIKESEEDNVPGEGKIFYDIRFSVYTEKELLKVLINIEAQKSTKPSKLGYHLDNRIIYYMSRMISAQKEVEFAKSNYDSLKPIRSIWICMDADDTEDSINRIRFRQETIYGKDMTLENIDKVQGVIIRLRKNENTEKSRNELIAMLEELLRKESAEVKKKRLADDYGLVMNIDTVRRIDEMCNLSQVVLEQGYEQGIEHGIQQGISMGELKGKVIARFEDGMPIEEIALKSHISVDEVTEILKEKKLITE